MGTESRRVAVDKIMPFATLQQLIKNMFAAELPTGAFVIKYRDDENDLVAICSDLELEEAVRQIPENESMKMLRLYLNETSPASVAISAASFTDLGISSPVSASSSSAVPEVIPVAVPASAPAVSAPNSCSAEIASEKVESSSPAEPVVPNASAVPSATAPVSSSQIVRDLNVLDLIEKRLQEAFKAVSTIMNTLELEKSMAEVIDGCHKAFTEVSEAAQNKIITPLSHFTKSKKSDFGKELEKFQAEIQRLQQQLKAEVEKAIASFSSSSSSSPATSCEEPKAAEPAVASVYPAVPVEENLPETAALDDLNKLAEMGFVDRVRNLELLAKHNGNVLAVVEELLSA